MGKKEEEEEEEEEFNFISSRCLGFFLARQMPNLVRTRLIGHGPHRVRCNNYTAIIQPSI
jgi:hypothetical protein